MFEVILFKGTTKLFREVCASGELLPTIARLMERREADAGPYEYQQNYAIQWRMVNET